MKWILFDCFNTLIDDFDEKGDEWGLNCISHLPVELGLSSSSEAFKRDYKTRRKLWFSSHNEKSLDKRLLDLFGKDKKHEVEMIVSIFKEKFLDELRLTSGVEEMLMRVAKKYQLAVVSNFFIPDYVSHLLDHFGLRKYFNFVLESASIGKKKPGHEIYKLALKRIPAQVNRNEIVFVGDNLKNDALIPYELGMKGIYFYRHRERPNVLVPPENIDYIESWNDFMH